MKVLCDEKVLFLTFVLNIHTPIELMISISPFPPFQTGVGGLSEARGDRAEETGGGAPGPAELRVQTVPGDHDDQQV